MRIYSMTATFGKLEHQTLTLEPGLNVIEAPNEWGKSTWCAFLMAMLYGIDTSSRSKKDFLADKERYAPWSGQPMSGRMELQWQGRDITIERSTKGRVPFGQFLAYETETHVAVPELTADNCGQQLLGVEREVFLRAGFLRLGDLPVTQDEALRRRLNALVTTGDESGQSDVLAQKLRELKNRCRHNKTGLIPQVQAKQQELLGKLSELEGLKEQCSRISLQQTQLAEDIKALKNHQAALAWERARQAQEHLEAAKQEQETAVQELRELEQQCRQLPAEETARQELQRLEQLQLQWSQLQAEAEVLPPEPKAPQVPAPFAGLTGEQAVQQAKSDGSAYNMLCKPVLPVLPILSGVFLLAAIGLAFYNYLFSLPCLVLAALMLSVWQRNRVAQKRDRKNITDRYGNENAGQWVTLAQDYAQSLQTYQQEAARRVELENQLTGKQKAWKQTLELLTQGKTIPEATAYWNRVLQQKKALEEAQLRCRRAEQYAKTLDAVAELPPKPEQPDNLTLTQERTEQALAQASAEQQLLHRRLGQCQGQMEALGDRQVLEQELEQVNARLQKLEDTYTALTLAQDTLTAAATELQRRFAPRIASRAQDLFSRLTGSRYDRLLLGEDLSLSAAAQEEDTLHGSLWRSEGTVDQLYLALRLAVAEELTPEAPMVLDDALVRFDDTRLEAAMEILKEEAQTKQVILFTCQNREKRYKE